MLLSEEIKEEKEYLTKVIKVLKQEFIQQKNR